MKRKRESDAMDHCPRSPYPRTASSNAPSSQRTSSDSSAHWDAPPRIEISEVDSHHSAHRDHATISPPATQPQESSPTRGDAGSRHPYSHSQPYSDGTWGAEEEMEVEPTGDVDKVEDLETSEREQRLRKRDYAIQMTRIMGRQLVSGISRGSRREAGM
ncbi:hypothetical protein P154DRAFT_217592 [Amniculicola lignicola CBS 123094]|uniref:Uncharacterized protein n=1 Tax=Amniculicola lignicola CBS 123094 TaxID=1392246 RepID=A0A6A5WE13_9PLEO|nr:hypothetical protein P154DRAFT_217592 [Amniculicola lignicola CBS 123094]